MSGLDLSATWDDLKSPVVLFHDSLGPWDFIIVTLSDSKKRKWN